MYCPYILFSSEARYLSLILQSPVLIVAFMLPALNTRPLRRIAYTPKIFSSLFMHSSQLIIPLSPLCLGSFSQRLSSGVVLYTSSSLVLLSLHLTSSFVHFSKALSYLREKLAMNLLPLLYYLCFILINWCKSIIIIITNCSIHITTISNGNEKKKKTNAD